MTLSATPRRVPLLWLLLPMCLGIIGARSVSLATAAALALIGIVACVAAYRLSAAEQTRYWTTCVCVAAVALGLLRAALALPDLSQAPLRVPREAALEINIVSLFSRNDPDRQAGLAQIASASLHLESQIGSRIYFSLQKQPEQPDLVIGETYAANGVLRPLSNQPQQNSGFENYLQKQGVSHRYVQGHLHERAGKASPLRYGMQRSSDAIANILSENKHPESEYTSAYKAMMLGRKNELSSEQRDLFLRNGAMHLFAISGLHIGVIAACAHHLLVLIRIRRSWRPPLSLLMVLAFVLSTGGSPSSWRALLMVACFYLCQSVQRQVSPLNALTLSAIVYLLISPLQLFQAGFQMSYLTVASILLIGVPLARLLDEKTPLFADLPPSARGKGQRAILWIKRWLLGALAVSIAAYASSALLGLYYFQIVPSYGVVVNLIALPLASIAIIAGFLAVVCAPLPGLPLSEVFNNAAISSIASTQWILERFLALPGASISTHQPGAASLAACLILIFGLACLAYAKSATPRALIWQCAPLAAAVLSLVVLTKSH